ncbi:AMP-binding enzyme [Popillia japonica]|uniref:AMP-binding enzyme n=1 Tax=Popillia japonica TaxID=7064 RepID=A0AAW1KH73_POPJA
MHHFGVLTQLRNMSKVNQIPLGVIYSPLAWVSGQIIALVHMATGTARLVCSTFTPEKTLRYLNKYAVISVSLPPQDAMLMLKHGNPEKIESPYLRMVIIAGGKISLENMRAVSRIFSNTVLVVCPYGQSEIYGPAFSFDPQELLSEIYGPAFSFDPQLFMLKPTCVGKPIEGFFYKIVDPATDKICGPNESGELCIKSRFCMSGYYKLDSSDRFDSDGFLKTGDVAYYDEDHCFYIVERLGERLKYKSQWIPPVLLEGILYEHPAVKVACIIGIISADGDTVTAVVVKKAEVSEAELVKLVNDRVDDIKKIRGGVIFVEDSIIPYTFSGKIRRFLLKKNFRGGFYYTLYILWKD